MLREAPLLLQTEPSRGHVRTSRLERGAGGHRGEALGLVHGKLWPRLALAGQAAGSSSVAAEQLPDVTTVSGSLGDGGELGRRRDGSGGAPWEEAKTEPAAALTGRLCESGRL